MLPILDGYEVCRILWKKSNVPILMLTAKDDEFDRVLGLEMGADDYLTKLFSMREFMARVKAQLLRIRFDKEDCDIQQIADGGEILVFDNLEIDNQRHEARIDGDPLNINPK